MGNFLFMHHFKFVAGTDFRHQNRRIRVVSLNRKVLESYNITTILTTLRTTTRYNFSVPMYTWWKRNCDLIYLNIYISLQHTSNCPAQKILVESTKPFTLVVDNISIEVLFFFSNIGSIWKKIWTLHGDLPLIFGELSLHHVPMTMTNWPLDLILRLCPRVRCSAPAHKFEFFVALLPDFHVKPTMGSFGHVVFPSLLPHVLLTSTKGDLWQEPVQLVIIRAWRKGMNRCEWVPFTLDIQMSIG